jgi:hypothetical protein
MKAAAWKVNPDYWFEVIYWDGNIDKPNDKYKRYKELGYEYAPERYQGWVQYTMWLLTPRVAREWRASTDTKDRWWKHFEVVMESVDRVYEDPVLRRFWQKGELVPNRAHEHPFGTDIPKVFKDVDRWFALDTNLDPPRPWKLDTKLPVFALARVTGSRPSREWLVYAHAPMGDKKDVEITIPDYGKITVDVALGGSFYLVKEVNGDITQVGK